MSCLQVLGEVVGADEVVAEGAEEEAGADDNLYSRTFTVCIFLCSTLSHRKDNLQKNAKFTGLQEKRPKIFLKAHSLSFFSSFANMSRIFDENLAIYV